MLSLPKPIPIQLLLYKMTTCLTQPVTTFFCPPNEKQPLQNFYAAEKWEAMFIKTVYLRLTYVFPIIIVVRALDSQFSSLKFKTAGWL